ncbi:hypothetical protein DL96DRAFT_1598953 [Flagelloscypha sp. PMI_526]|nr:hypothetical protein DL96DRAFT_1598953 [Flagelloscypha sp. PMI_526]
MPLKKSVLEAFETLEITVDTPQAEGTKAYKKLALKHHPDKNPGDPSATERFQKVRHLSLASAWNIVSKHYENPQSSEEGAHDFADDYDSDEDEDLSFFMWMFQETMSGRRFNRRDRRRGGARGPRVRYQVVHTARGTFIVPIFGDNDSGDEADYIPPRQQSAGSSSGFWSSGPSRSGTSSSYGNFRWESESPQDAQQRAREQYEQRLEREVAEEERQKKEMERERSMARAALANSYSQAFEAARAGNLKELQAGIFSLEHWMLTRQRNLGLRQMSQRRRKRSNSKSLLHAAARGSGADVLAYLVDKGADTSAENPNSFTPAEGCHPSKALADGRTPLQVAVAQDHVEVVKLLVKDATVHDVQRLWALETTLPEVKRVLETKKGFTPGVVLTDDKGQLLTKKALRKLEEKKQAEEKAARKAEQSLNELRKAEKRAKLEEDRRIQQQIMEMERRESEAKDAEKRKLEADERRKVEEAERLAEEDRKRRELFERKKREEEETRRQEEELRRYEATERLRREREAVEVQARRELEARDRRQREEDERLRRMEANRRRQEEERARKEHEEALRQEEQLRKQESARLQKEQAKQRQEEAKRQKLIDRRASAKERKRAEKAAQRIAEEESLRADEDERRRHQELAADSAQIPAVKIPPGPVKRLDQKERKKAKAAEVRFLFFIFYCTNFSDTLNRKSYHHRLRP